MKQKRMAVLSFTENGQRLGEKIETVLESSEAPDEWIIERVHRPIPLKQWMENRFQSLDALIFIGAMGIIVREMAPYLKSKLTDPAVVVMDEKGQFAISVLSGHLGGANALAKKIAQLLGAVPVITTASDVNEKIAVDVFAKKNDLSISSMKQAKLCAAKIVAGALVSFSCAGEILGSVPGELSADPKDAEFHVEVTPYLRKEEEKKLHLIPKAFVLGIGCKKGTLKSTLERRVQEELEKQKIDQRSIKGIASIDLKCEESGLLAYAKEKNLPISFYSAEELKDLEGSFTPSAFVAGVTGIENVCERAAFRLAMENGKKHLEECMVLPKSGKDGVTVSIMKIDWRVRFE